MWGYGPSMMGYGSGGYMLFGGIIWILIVALIAYAVVKLSHNPDRASRETRSSALDVLEERYVRGEIGRDEYLEKKNDISGSGSAKK